MKLLQILIIDDDEDDRELFCEAVKELKPSINCAWANNGYDAIDLLNRKETVLPDLIFLDLNMPRLNGKQCLVLIKSSEKLSGIQVIMYSTSKYQKDIDESIELGAHQFLTKPDTMQELKDLVTKIIVAKRKELN